MGKKVLVVDDERLIVKGIKFSLVQKLTVLMMGKKPLKWPKRQNMILFCLT